MSARHSRLLNQLDAPAYDSVPFCHPSRVCRNYLDLTAHAFKTCVHSFTHQELTAREIKCIQNTTRKSLSASVRATARFAELQSEAVAKARSQLSGAK